MKVKKGYYRRVKLIAKSMLCLGNLISIVIGCT